MKKWLTVVPFFFSFLTIAQNSNLIIDADAKLKSLLGNQYEKAKQLPGGKISESLKNYKIENGQEKLNAQNTYVYENGLLKEMIFESGFETEIYSKQKFTLVYNNTDEISAVEYSDFENGEWNFSNKTEYSTDETGFGDSVRTFFYQDGNWSNLSVITYTKSNEGKTIESIGNYLNAESGKVIALIKQIYKLDDKNRLSVYEYYDFDVIGKNWVHKYDYEFTYNENNQVTEQILKGYSTGHNFKTVYTLTQQGSIDQYELFEILGDQLVPASKNVFVYDQNGFLTETKSYTYKESAYSATSKTEYENDEFGNPLTISYFYPENGEMILREKNNLTYLTASSIPDQTVSARDFVLNTNYPNPFNPSTKISFNLNTNQHVDLKIFDLSGREIMTLINRNMNAGFHEIPFDGKNYSSGVYFYQLRSGNQVETKKMILAK